MLLRWSSTAAGAFVAAALLTGCSSESQDYRALDSQDKAAADAAAHEDHGHGEKGPHGGDIVEFGDHSLHAEVVVDEEKNVLDIYILGADGKTEQTIDAKELKLSFAHGDKSEDFLVAAPADAAGPVSKFSVTSEELVEELHEHEHATLSFTAGGKEYSGTVHHHHDHGHEGHAHGDAEKKADAAAPAADSKPAEAAPEAKAEEKPADAPAEKPAAEAEKPGAEKPVDAAK